MLFRSLKYGVDHIDKLIAESNDFEIPVNEVKHYLKKSISYDLNEAKRKGLDHFLNLLKTKKKINGYSIGSSFTK